MTSQLQQATLSNLITRMTNSGANVVLEFLEAFQQARLGVVLLEPSEKLAPVLGAGLSAISLGTTTFNDGKFRLLAFADPEVFSARYGRKFNGTMMGAQLLDAVRECFEFEGILVNSAISVNAFAVERSHLRSIGEGGLPSRGTGKPVPTLGQIISGIFFGKNLAKQLDVLVVPPGHKLAVAHPPEKPYVARSESGIWLAGVPVLRQIELVASEVLQIEARGQRERLVWILCATGFEPIDLVEQLVSVLSGVALQTKARLVHSLVVPHARLRHYYLMKRISDIGFQVHTSHEDGACFIEVHKPSGIVAGMAGKAFEA